MAPGRKQKNKPIFKSPSNTYVHPSLTTRSAANAATAGQQETAATVNEQIQYLRRVQRPRPRPESTDAASVLAKLRISNPPRHQLAGPPPPRSWARGDVSGSADDGSSHVRVEKRPRKLDYFPGVRIPPQRSLLYQSMKSLAADFDWHLEFDHVYLSMLPVELKDMLLTYVARHGPANGISLSALKVIFGTPAVSGLDESTGGANDITHLDLGVSIGRAIPIVQLEKHMLLKGKRPRQDSRDKSTASLDNAMIPETWDQSHSTNQHTPLTESPLRYPSLTHLSLAYPGESTSWMTLISLLGHQHNLTHLNLAGWPLPSFPSTSTPDLDYLPTHHHASPPLTRIREQTELDILDEADFILRTLARSTPNLTYLSLADWHANYPVLLYTPHPSSSTTATYNTNPWLASLRTARGPRLRRADMCFASDTDRTRTSHTEDQSQSQNQSQNQTRRATSSSVWSSAWRGLRTLDLSQSDTIPLGIEVSKLKSLYERRTERRTAEGKLLDDYGDELPTRGRTPIIEERYVLQGARTIIDVIQKRENWRMWIEKEAATVKVGRFVNAQRLAAGLRPVMILYGWGVDELRQAGYSKEDVWRITGEKGDGEVM